MRFFSKLSIDSFYFSSIRTIKLFFKYINLISNYSSSLFLVEKISFFDHLYSNSLFLHNFLNQNISFIIPSLFFSNYISISGTGGDSKNTLNLTTISTIFLRLLGINVLKNNSYSYLTNKGSLNFVSELLSLDFSKTNLFSFFLLRRKFLFYNFSSLLDKNFFGSNFFKIRSSISKATLFNYSFSTFNYFKTKYFFLGVNSLSHVFLCSSLLSCTSSSYIVFNSYNHTDEPVLNSKLFILKSFMFKQFCFVINPSKLLFTSTFSNNYLFARDTFCSLYSFFSILNGFDFLIFETVVFFVCLVLNLKYNIRINFSYSFLHRVNNSGFFYKKFNVVKYFIR